MSEVFKNYEEEYSKAFNQISKKLGSILNHSYGMNSLFFLKNHNFKKKKKLQ